MSNWQQAMQAKIALDPDKELRAASIWNAEFYSVAGKGVGLPLLGTEPIPYPPHTGHILYVYATKTYVVRNKVTDEGRENLAEHEVEAVMQELDIANSEWS